MLVIYQVLNLSITLYTERTSRIIWRRSVMRFLQSYQNMLIGKMLDSAVGLQHPSPNCCFSTSVCVSLLEGTACVSRRRTRSRYGWAESKLHLRMPPSNRSAIMCRLKTFTLEPHSAPPLSCLSTVLQTGVCPLPCEMLTWRCTRDSVFPFSDAMKINRPTLVKSADCVLSRRRLIAPISLVLPRF